MGAQFGFMAFLGAASLIGVIVSHIIVLFDCIEERHEQGAPLREAVLDAGILLLRPVMVGIPGAAAYASSKAGVRNHSKTVALYCAEQGLNIRCNSIHPAAILTPL